jgi:hypothetical protein
MSNNDHRPYYWIRIAGPPAYIMLGAFIGAVLAPFSCGDPRSMVYCVLAWSACGAILGGLAWWSADDYKRDKVKLDRPTIANISQAPATTIAVDQARSFPGWIKGSIVGSIFAIILAFVLSSLYYIGVKLLMVPAFILFLVGLAMFAVGMSAARNYDGQRQ